MWLGCAHGKMFDGAMFTVTVAVVVVLSTSREREGEGGKFWFRKLAVISVSGDGAARRKWRW